MAIIAIALYRLYALTETCEFQTGILQRAFVKLCPLEKSYVGILSEQALLEVIQTEGQLVLRPMLCSKSIH